jgi:hypothetical protein
MSRNPIRKGIARVFARLQRLRSPGGECPEQARLAAAAQDTQNRRLRRYEEELEKLRVENEHLRLSATTFGELAERLNSSLKTTGDHGRTPVPRGG